VLEEMIARLAIWGKVAKLAILVMWSQIISSLKIFHFVLKKSKGANTNLWPCEHPRDRWNLWKGESTNLWPCEYPRDRGIREIRNEQSGRHWWVDFSQKVRKSRENEVRQMTSQRGHGQKCLQRMPNWHKSK
jgi:hypothetical protein